MRSQQQGLSRRDFMKGAAVAGAAGIIGAALSGCSANGDTGSIGDNAVSTVDTPKDAITWEKEADVVVAGAGAGGLCAAIAAANAGASVIVLEKATADESGGNTRVSGNMWTCPTDAKEGVKYYVTAAERISDTDTNDYLTTLAEAVVTLNDDFLLDMPDMEPKEIPIFSPEFAALPGGEAIQAYANKGQTGESQLWASLQAGAEELDGVEFMYETPGVRLITDATGAVIGIVAESGGAEINVKAKKGVILATGGYEYDHVMVENSYPGWPVYSRGTPYNTGDGIKMAQKVGAGLWHMNASDSGVGAVLCKGLNFGHGAYDSDMVPANISFSVASAQSNHFIAVDKYGKRFMPEDRADGHGYGKREYLFFYDGVKCEWPRLPFWTVFDAQAGPACKGSNEAAMSKFTWFAAYSGYEWSKDNSAEVEKGWILKGETIEDLAQQMEVDPAVLAETIETYNSYAESGADAEFGRAAETMAPLTGPFFAAKTYPTQYNTQGGPKRNTKSQTLDAFNEPIPGLYNVGECGAGYGWVYNGGWNNAEAMQTGIWAGEDAAARESWDA